MTEFVCRRTGQAYEVGEQLDQDGHAVVHAVVSAGPDLALKQYLPATLQQTTGPRGADQGDDRQSTRLPPRPRPAR